MMSRKRTRSASPSASTSSDQIFRSEPIEDRDSTFIGLYSRKLDVNALRASSDIQSATHRMAAWRVPSKQRTIASTAQHSPQSLYDVGSDDDGEKWAGKKLETVLSNLKVEGCVVVARWYGGTMLGPVRFAHIENCAKNAISAWHVAEGEARKRQKIEAEDKEDKLKLEKILAERDGSIVILRGLLAEKRRSKAGESSSQVSTVSSTSPSKSFDYTTMPLQALRRLEKARDATLAFILKELDKVEGPKRPPSPSATLANENSTKHEPG